MERGVRPNHQPTSGPALPKQPFNKAVTNLTRLIKNPAPGPRPIRRKLPAEQSNVRIYNAADGTLRGKPSAARIFYPLKLT
jgi:hypothetical protein